ncbi:MAG: hypothetical protein BHW55_00285 [Candidatus Melainabacteria bacterium 35_41]|nr:MAG: hypothetical protein BHW55_00285 [Candidatus Melainabacteria bacterium 35_41]
MKFYYKYYPLLQLNNSEFHTIAETGGRGGGKTQHTIRGVLKCLIERKKNCCFFRETKESLEDSVKAEIDDIIANEFEGRGFSSLKTEIRHANGSRIFFKGLKQVNAKSIENLKGIASSTDFFVIDEAQAVSKPVLKALVATLRKAGSVLIVLYNRISDNLPVEDVLYLDYQTMTAPEGTYFIEVNYPELEQAGFLSQEFLTRANLKKLHKPEEYEEEYLNKAPDLSAHTVVKHFTNDNIKPIFYQPDMDLHISCDFNVDPMCWVFFHKTQNKLFFFDELIIENTTTPICANEVIRRFPNHKGGIIINGDASGNYKNVAAQNPDITNYVQIKNILERYYNREVEIEIKRGNPLKKNRIAAFNELVLDTNGKRRVFFDSKCKWCIYNIKNVKYKAGTSKIDEPTINDIKADPQKKFLIHPFDAFTYPADYYFPIRLN